MIENAKIAASRQSHTVSELECLERALSEANEAVQALETKISPALRQQTLDKVQADAPEEQLVPVAAAIREQRRRLERLTNMLRDMAQRVEL